MGIHLLEWMVAGLGLLGLPVQAAAPDLTLNQAQMVRLDTAEFPAQAVASRVVLPDVWDRASGDTGPAWYRLGFNLALPVQGAGQGLGLYIERACARVQVRLNGQWLHGDVDGARGCHLGLLLALPPGLLREGANTLDLKLEGQPIERVALRERAAGLSAPRIAPWSELVPLVQDQNSLGAGLALAFSMMAVFAGLVALVLAASSRLPYLAWFGAAALGWGLLTLALQFGPAALPGTWMDFVLCAAVPPIALAAMFFLLRYCGIALAWLDYALALQCVVVPVSLVIALPDRLHGVARPWSWIVLVELAAVLVAFLYRAWRMSRPDFWVVGAGLAVFGLTAALEWALALPMVLPAQPAANLALLVVLAGMAWRLHQLYQAGRQKVEIERRQMEQRISELASAAIEAERQIGQVDEQKVEEVALKERKRIAADLHDDLGAKLLTIVHTSDNERIATLAREALEEMRLSVRGIAGKPVVLGDSVGDWRSEAMSRLSQGGIELIWNVPDELLMSEQKISARAYVQTTRILREAVSNMIKHSGASQCEIAIRLNDNDFEFNIVDNGKGIPMELDGRLDRGHGMSTMKTRAKQLQGQCLVESGPGMGTAIRLTLPI
jgi:signal transduction histidine kinase